MATVLKCPDCGHSKPSDDGEPETCPQCEGTMAAPPKKKYQAKSSSLEDEERAKKKAKARDEEEKPKKKAPPRDEDEDEDEKPKTKTKKPSILESRDKGSGDYTTDERIAERIGIDPGFGDRELLDQVAGELARGEVVHFICRPSRAIAKVQAVGVSLGGLLFCLIGAGAGAFMLTSLKGKAPDVALIIPCVFVLVGLVIAIGGTIMKLRQARLGWYAVTDRRAIVFHIGLFGKFGRATTYQPFELKAMWVQKSWLVKGGGDVVFKTIITQTTTTTRNRRTGLTSSSTSTSKQHFGFLGVEDVKDVEAVIREVLLCDGRRDEDDEEEEERPRKKAAPRDEDD
ncbi:MAG: hypothetical protein J0I06_20780 [Planctomycetes bacterium]|nr:hypothetical protein [Planctomycetota bacterium]